MAACLFPQTMPELRLKGFELMMLSKNIYIHTTIILPCPEGICSLAAVGKCFGSSSGKTNWVPPLPHAFTTPWDLPANYSGLAQLRPRWMRSRKKVKGLL